jgi:hypothetical protein
VVDVDLKAEFMARQDIAGVILAIVEISIEGTVGELTAKILDGREFLGEQVDRTSKGRGSDSGGGAGTAVEVDAAEELRGEEGPGVVSGAVSVVEGDAVEVDVVLLWPSPVPLPLRVKVPGAIATASP